MCVDMGGGGGSHFRGKGGSQGGSQKGGSREPYEPPWLRA